MMRILAIDVGSNSIRSIIADADASERTDAGVGERATFSVVNDRREQTRLGISLDSAGNISPEAADDSVEALRKMVAKGRRLGVDRVRAIATAAVRDAPNGCGFVNRVRDETGLELEVIDGAEEGRLAYLSAARHFELAEHSVVFDLGGGSIEIVSIESERIASVMSARLGAVRMSAHLSGTDPVSDAEFIALQSSVAEELAAIVQPGGDEPMLVGSGGTTNAIGSIMAARAGMPEGRHGRQVSLPEVLALLGELRQATAAQRRAIPGMPPHRVDIITAGVLVVAELMRALGAHELHINANGVREGLVIDTLQRANAAGSAAR